MFLPNYRAWVVVASLVVCLATWFVIERTKLGAYLRAAHREPDAGAGLRHQRAAMITLTYGFGVGARRASPACWRRRSTQVNPLMGADLIIVVFAVVVIGGMGSILGSIVTGFGLGVVEGLTKVFYPEASNTVIFVIMAIVLLVRPAGPVREGGVRWRRADAVASRERAAADAARTWLAFAVLLALVCVAPFVALPGVPDEGAVLRAVRLRLQPAARLRRACCRSAMRRSSASAGYVAGARRQGLGLPPELGHPRRHGWSPALLGLGRRRARHPPPGHLLRDDHAGACADGLLLLPAGAVHRRRGRHPGGAARHACFGVCRPAPTT